MFRAVVFVGPNSDHRLLSATLAPVGQELRLALIGKRMIE
jgi:hypothetical protein